MAYDKQSDPCISILPKKRNYFASLDKTLVEEKKKLAKPVSPLLSKKLRIGHIY